MGTAAQVWKATEVCLMAHMEPYMEVYVHRSRGRTANLGEDCFRHKALVQPG